MLFFVRSSFLLISICIRSKSWAATTMQVTPLIGATGQNITIRCATDKKHQDGAYMYKQKGASEPQEIFYFYKKVKVEGFPSYKTHKSKVTLSGEFPNLNVKLSHVTAEDNGLYWCEFNSEEKITTGNYTWLWIEKDCPEDVFPSVIILVLCAVILLCIIGFFCVILKMKGCLGNRKYKPSNPPSDSVYEEMKRSNLNTQPAIRTFINPDYQSSKQIR